MWATIKCGHKELKLKIICFDTIIIDETNELSSSRQDH